jgi:hypothetical protein
LCILYYALWLAIGNDMAEKERLEEQIGEVLGLEMAAQKAVEELSAKGLLDKGGLKSKLQGMKKEAGTTRQGSNN